MLLGTACFLLLVRTMSLRPSIDTLSIILLGIAAAMALGIARSGGLTGFFGLFFISTLVFNLGRPLLWLVFRDEDIYDLAMGITTNVVDRARQADLLIFWGVGIASVAAGYFLFYRTPEFSRPPLSINNRAYCQSSFWVTLVLVCAAIPVAAATKIAAFSSEGYTALYVGQTQYSFSWFRLLDFLLPTLFALSVLLRDTKFIAIVATTVVANALISLGVGQRATMGQWILVTLWYLSTIQRRKMNKWLLVSSGFALVILFQFIADWREGYDSILTVQQFVTEQSTTFSLPTLMTELPPPPAHTVVGSILPLGAVYSVFGIGTAADMNLGNYLSSQFDMGQFEQGRGLGGTVYLELFYLSGRLWVLYSILCVTAGVVLAKWERCSFRHNWAVFYLCICLPDVIFLPRGSLYFLSSHVIYVSLYMTGIYCLTALFAVPSDHEQQMRNRVAHKRDADLYLGHNSVNTSSVRE